MSEEWDNWRNHNIFLRKFKRNTYKVRPIVAFTRKELQVTRLGIGHSNVVHSQLVEKHIAE